ncbi:hypothetical protein NPIL_32741 [Nephila pilipes]|uniref:Uncharacterized protein n=1 Tax=Nephila pilipes TaxID=299642 RepID=A0A8X6N8Q1_NEPPI|nr:hypothetical protein NPIL_32741 [Nephila pilipes]
MYSSGFTVDRNFFPFGFFFGLCFKFYPVSFPFETSRFFRYFHGPTVEEGFHEARMAIRTGIGPETAEEVSLVLRFSTEYTHNSGTDVLSGDEWDLNQNSNTMP